MPEFKTNPTTEFRRTVSALLSQLAEKTIIDTPSIEYFRNAIPITNELLLSVDQVHNLASVKTKERGSTLEFTLATSSLKGSNPTIVATVTNGYDEQLFERLRGGKYSSAMSVIFLDEEVSPVEHSITDLTLLSFPTPATIASTKSGLNVLLSEIIGDSYLGAFDLTSSEDLLQLEVIEQEDSYYMAHKSESSIFSKNPLTVFHELELRDQSTTPILSFRFREGKFSKDLSIESFGINETSLTFLAEEKLKIYEWIFSLFPSTRLLPEVDLKNLHFINESDKDTIIAQFAKQSIPLKNASPEVTMDFLSDVATALQMACTSTRGELPVKRKFSDSEREKLLTAVSSLLTTRSLNKDTLYTHIAETVFADRYPGTSGMKILESVKLPASALRHLQLEATINRNNYTTSGVMSLFSTLPHPACGLFILSQRNELYENGAFPVCMTRWIESFGSLESSAPVIRALQSVEWSSSESSNHYRSNSEPVKQLLQAIQKLNPKQLSS